MPGQHTSKEKRQAAHIKASYVAKGKSPEEAERLAWKVVNSMRERPKGGEYVRRKK